MNQKSHDMPPTPSHETDQGNGAPGDFSQGLVAVVTGGSRGIGKALVLLLLERGWSVFFCSRRQESDLDWLAELPDTLRSKICYQQADLSTRAGCLEMAEAVTARLGHLDMLVHNAGAFVGDHLLDAPEGQLEGQMALHVYSAYFLSRAWHPLLLRSSRPYVFHMCSVASLRAYPGGASYCISKFALLGLSRMMRLEWMADGIAVSAVVPGAVYTDSWADSPWPAERLMPAEDVAEAILHAYHASPRTVYEEILLRPAMGDL
jgi:NAD(P)-dependent dehydrogenase (short-subunit alcohol dehydrogenase family)